MNRISTGIAGLDSVFSGGLPAGCVTVIRGGPGTGKTLMAQSIALAAAEQAKNVYYLHFEESEPQLIRNAEAIGLDMQAAIQKGSVLLDAALPPQTEIVGDFSLEATLLRIGGGVDRVGASVVVLDTLEALSARFHNPEGPRRTISGLFHWVRERGLTLVATAENRDTLYGDALESYVADVVIALDHMEDDGVLTRRLRVSKARGIEHQTNSYPFLIGPEGLIVAPITNVSLEYDLREGYVSTGTQGLDDLLEHRGVRVGSTTLVTGSPGCGKTMLSAAFAAAACDRGERAVIFAFDESPAEFVNDTGESGGRVEDAVSAGQAHIVAARPTSHGLERHLVRMFKLIDDNTPDVVIIDPASSLLGAGTARHTQLTVLRLVDYMKSKGITGWLTAWSEPHGPNTLELEVASSIDTWISLARTTGDKRERSLEIVKSRGQSARQGLSEFEISSRGIEVVTSDD